MSVTSTTFGKRMLTIGILNEVFDSTIQNSFHFFFIFVRINILKLMLKLIKEY